MRPLTLFRPLTLPLAACAAICVPGFVAAQAAPAPTAPKPDANGVILIDGATTREAFTKGRPLIETGAYKIHASRRDAPGIAELHDKDTDILYILDGTATFVTGGRTVDPKTTGPGETRGTRVEGGTSRTVAKGDIIIIPAGVPHQFSEVKGPILYYTVKVTGTGAR
jgi:mannose-6-phosphate isomerase-like protein (cupin superfamily)